MRCDRQTLYRSVFPPGNRTFSRRRLSGRACPERRFTIRMVDFANRSDGRPVVWSAVVGLKERFTAAELLQFPSFVLLNHGTVWNGLGWTIWVNLLLGAPLLLYLAGYYCCSSRGLAMYRPAQQPGLVVRKLHCQPWSPRQLLHSVALIFFVGAALEMLVHLVYVQCMARVASEFAIGLLAVCIAPNALGVLVVLFADTTPCRWSPMLEVAAGVALLFAIGAGLYGGPICLILAGGLGALAACEQT